MTVLYPQYALSSVEWRDFTGYPRYTWYSGHDWDDETTGNLYEVYDGGPVILPVAGWLTFSEAKRSLQQLGHRMGEWDD